jgi:prevent-host-death family protein
VEEIAVSKFKATCLDVLRKVQSTGIPILITRRGEPVAQLMAPPTPPRSDSWLGSGRDTVEILGDIVSPCSLEDWEVLDGVSS